MLLWFFCSEQIRSPKSVPIAEQRSSSLTSLRGTDWKWRGKLRGKPLPPQRLSECGPWTPPQPRLRGPIQTHCSSYVCKAFSEYLPHTPWGRSYLSWLRVSEGSVCIYSVPRAGTVLHGSRSLWQRAAAHITNQKAEASWRVAEEKTPFRTYIL